MELPPLTSGRIKLRYKRFLADVELGNGETVVAHCPNTGSMNSCWQVDAPVELSHSDNPKRKLRWTLERVDMGRGWVGVNTSRVNAVIAEGIGKQLITPLTGYSELKREPAFNIEGYAGSRFDMLLSGHPKLADAYVEVKNATLLDGDQVTFPDAVTQRGRKHLHLLREAVRLGYRAAVVFAINRPEGSAFAPAWDIDPEYAQSLEEVAEAGVLVIAVRLQHTRTAIEVTGSATW
jgi:sugar fermentation stimulation protein A